MSATHTVEIATDVLVNPRMPGHGIIAEMGDDTRIAVTVIADNPLSSCNYKLTALQCDGTTIATERKRLEDQARNIGYSGIAQIADYRTGECVTFQL